MGDGWTDGRNRSLINFLVYCPKGIAFIKSVAASGIVTDAQLLCTLFSKIVDMIGASNVMHLVTDDGSNSPLGEWLFPGPCVNTGCLCTGLPFLGGC